MDGIWGAAVTMGSASFCSPQIPSPHTMHTMAQLGLSISLLQERAGVMNPAIQDMADHVAVTDNPKMSVIYMILFLHRTPDSR